MISYLYHNSHLQLFQVLFEQTCILLARLRMGTPFDWQRLLNQRISLITMKNVKGEHQYFKPGAYTYKL